MVQQTRRDERIAAAAAQIRHLGERVPEAPNLATLRGYEGEGARIYFGAFPALIVNSAFPWKGRSRRPPRDPINACLSLGYTLLSQEVESAILGVGLLTGVGALHELGPGRATLVFDLVEEFRAPVVDRLVLRLINREQLAPEDFVDPAWLEPSFPAPRPGESPQEAAASSGGMSRQRPS
jgi:CRISPR-associated protein Cas1